MTGRRHPTGAIAAGTSRRVRVNGAAATPFVSDPGLLRWLPAFAAALLFSAVVAVGLVANAAGTEQQATDAEPNPSPGTASIEASAAAPSPTAPPPTVTTPATPAPDAPADPIPLSRTLGDGVTGPDVRRVQRRLTELGFNPGGVDGVFGPLTIQAVWAYEKLVAGTPREQATGQVTPVMWDAMQQPRAVTPRRPQPAGVNHTEIYLPEQVIAVFHDGLAVFVAHMSHGTGEEWCEEVTISPGEYGNEDGTEPLDVGRCGISNTPGGVFTYHRAVEGRRQSALGGMLNPVYFNYGIAVHGASNVPNQPASHGCVRIPNELSARYQSLVAIGERVYVWDGIEEPEVYGEQLPTFDWEWEEYAATTTTTTTTTAPPVTTTLATTPPVTSPPVTSLPVTSPPVTSPPVTTTPSAAENDISEGDEPAHGGREDERGDTAIDGGAIDERTTDG